jgi:hypothetical protein
MPYERVIQENQDHIRVEVSGNCIPGKELDDAMDILAQAADSCHKKGINCILAIWNVPGHLPPLTGYDLVEKAKEFNWDSQFKLAIVYLHNERFIDALFVETVAVNRGCRVKMFKNEQEAKFWLLDRESTNDQKS